MKLSTLLLASICALPLAACDKPADKTEDKTEADAKDTAKETAKTDDEKADAKDAHDAFTNLSPDDVQKLVADKGCTPVDANGGKTRSKYGIVPGAVLLSGADWKTSELPEDKKAKLVFYCGGQACMAAPKAAKVAQEAGYENVAVMRAGIRGWVDAGKTVEKPTT